MIVCNWCDRLLEDDEVIEEYCPGEDVCENCVFTISEFLHEEPDDYADTLDIDDDDVLVSVRA